MCEQNRSYSSEKQREEEETDNKKKLLELTIQHLKDDLLAKVGVIATQSKEIEELKNEIIELQS